MQKKGYLKETNIKKSLLLMIPWIEGIRDLHRRVMRKIVTNENEYQIPNYRMGKSKEQANRG